MPAVRRSGAVLAAAALLALTGCGSASKGPAAKASAQADPDKATATCRDTWADLGKSVADKADRTDPSALPERWNALAATVDYYATSATDKDCGDRLTTQKSAITALSAFETKLQPYDVPFRLAQVRDAATAYAAKPAPAVKPGGKKGAKPSALPQPKAVGAALKTLEAQAATATQQQGPGWQQAAVVDVADAAAVAKAVKDLAFLSSESAAYRACATALGTIAKSQSATR